IGAVLTNPLNVSMTSIVWAVVFRITVACPVPGEAAGGTSSTPVRLAVKVIMAALLADTGRISTAAKARRQERIELLGCLPPPCKKNGYRRTGRAVLFKRHSLRCECQTTRRNVP